MRRSLSLDGRVSRCAGGRAGRARSRRGASSRPGGRCPPIRSGSTLRVACTLRPDACSIRPTMPLELLVGELVRGRQLDVEHVLLARRRAPRTRRRSRGSRRRGPSRRAGGRSCGRARRRRRAPRSSTSAFTRDVGLAGSRAAPRARARRRARATRSASSSRTASSRPFSCGRLEERAGIDAVRGGYERARLQLREVDLGQRLVDQAPLVGARSASCG